MAIIHINKESTKTSFIGFDKQFTADKYFK